MAMYKATFVKGNTNPSTILIQTVGLLAFGCLGLTAAEKIAANFNDNKSNINGKSNTNP
jgi:amino acid permease